MGFCLYLRRACIDAVGLFRAEIFAQGYGEENDFCLRARHLGWRSVAAPGVFVAHVGGQSFGGAAVHLRARNAALLERLHPGYEKLIQAHVQRDPLATARRRLDLARWRDGRRRGGRSVIIVSHAEGGGVERQVQAAAERHRRTRTAGDRAAAGSRWRRAPLRRGWRRVSGPSLRDARGAWRAATAAWRANVRSASNCITLSAIIPQSWS